MNHPMRGTTSAPTAAPRRRRALIVTNDPELLHHLRVLAGRAGVEVEVEVATDITTAGRVHADAPLVLLGIDQAAATERRHLPPQARLVLVAHTAAPDRSEVTHLQPHYLAVLPEAEMWLVDQLATTHQHPAPVIAVIGGRGGAGATTLAAGLAVNAAAMQRRVLLVDGDPLGAGLDLLLGWEADPGHRWAELATVHDRAQAAAALPRLPRRGELSLLSHDRREVQVPTLAMQAVLETGRYHQDVTIVDVARWSDPAGQTTLRGADVTLLAVPARLTAVVAAAKIAPVVAVYGADVRLVLRPGELTADEVSTALGLPVAGMLRSDRSVGHAAENGIPPTFTGSGPLAVLCRKLVHHLSGPASTKPS